MLSVNSVSPEELRQLDLMISEGPFQLNYSKFCNIRKRKKCWKEHDCTDSRMSRAVENIQRMSPQEPKIIHKHTFIHTIFIHTTCHTRHSSLGKSHINFKFTSILALTQEKLLNQDQMLSVISH